MPNYIEMLRLYEAGFSLRQIAKLVSSGRNTVTRTIKIAQEKELSYDEVAQWSRHELETMFQLDRNKKDQPVSYYTMPDYKQLAKELAKPGVTMQLLWEEYAQEARLNHKIYYKLTQFKKHFNDYLAKTSFSHVLHHKAGEQVQVDWTVKRPQWIDPMTGKSSKATYLWEPYLLAGIPTLKPVLIKRCQGGLKPTYICLSIFKAFPRC